MQKLAAQAYMEGAAAALSVMDIDDSIKQASMDSLYEAAEYLGKGIVNPLGGDDKDYLRSAAGLGTAGLAGYGLYRAATSDAAKRYYDNLGKGVKNVATGNFGDIDKDQAIAMAGTGLGVGALAYGGKKLHEGYKYYKHKRRNKDIIRAGAKADEWENRVKNEWARSERAPNTIDIILGHLRSGVAERELESLGYDPVFTPEQWDEIYSSWIKKVPEDLRPSINTLLTQDSRYRIK